MSRGRGEAMGWYSGPDAARASRDACRSTAPRTRPSRSACRCNGSAGPTSISAASPARSRAAGSRPATRCASCRRAGSARIDRIVTLDGDLDEAVAGQSVTLTLTQEIDCSRGDVIAAAKDPPHAADQFEATIVWMADEPMIPGRGYWLKLGDPDRDRDRRPSQAPAQRQHARGAGGQDARPQRDRRRRGHDRPADRVRALSRRACQGRARPTARSAASS